MVFNVFNVFLLEQDTRDGDIDLFKGRTVCLFPWYQWADASQCPTIKAPAAPCYEFRACDCVNIKWVGEWLQNKLCLDKYLFVEPEIGINRI